MYLLIIATYVFVRNFSYSAIFGVFHYKINSLKEKPQVMFFQRLKFLPTHDHGLTADTSATCLT